MMLKSKLDRHQWAGVLLALQCWCMSSAAQNQNTTKPAHDSICLSEVVVSTRQQMMSVNQIGSQINQTPITNDM